ncbi:MAG: diguanylate cyclase [Cyanobacteria bacterium P01_E01_bin.42]
MQSHPTLSSKLAVACRNVPIQVTVVCGVLASLFVSMIVWQQERENLQSSLQEKTGNFSTALQKTIDDSVETLVLVANSTQSATAPSVDRQIFSLREREFALVAKDVLSETPALQRIDWIPRIKNPDRQMYEQEIQQIYRPTETNSEQSTGQLLEKAPDRPEYFPIAWSVARAGSEAILGWDLTSDRTLFLTMERARETGDITAIETTTETRRSPEPLGKRGQEGVNLQVFLPKYLNPGLYGGSNSVISHSNHSDITLGTQQKRENLAGFVAGTLTIAELVQAALPGVALENVSVYLYREDPAGKPQTLAFYESDTHTLSLGQNSPTPNLVGRGWLCPEFSPSSRSAASKGFRSLRQTKAAQPCTRTIKVADQQWSVLLLPTSAYNAPDQYWKTWITLASGLLGTSLLVAYLLVLQRYTNQVEGLVEEQTAELKRANEELHQTNFELQQTNNEIRILSEMGDLLQACFSINQAYAVISEQMPQLFPKTSGGLYIISESRNLVEAMSVWGRKLKCEKLFSPDECMALRLGQAHLVQETHCNVLCKNISSPVPPQHFCAPMMAQGETLGLLHLSSPKPKGLTEGQQQLAKTVAKNIALALANLKLRESLKHQSIRDPLTNLFNRRYLEACLEREVRRALSSQQPLGIMMLDLDHFKRFNDTFGHEAGDAVLREMGLFVAKHVRGSDIACRYGGEEFTLILPEASLEASVTRAEQIRDGIKHLNIQHRGQSLGPVTLSIGVAAFPEHGLSAEAVIQAADAALYEAKNSGRDRVVTSSIALSGIGR